MFGRGLAAAFIVCLAGGSAEAARCGGDFNSFVVSMTAEAQGAGVSAATTSAAFGGITQDGAVLAFDRRQRYTFNKSFEQYVSTRVGPGRINGGRALLQRHAALLSRIEQQFGVPRQILVAIWGLESDFGKGDIGKLPVIRTLATLAHDCRLGRRDRPDPVPAVVLHQIRRRFRRRRPRRPPPQRRRRARLDRKPAALQRLQDGPAL
jgi:membrane-bound lytic murein transglycosylase B